LRIAYISFEYPPDSANGGIATYLGQAAPMMARRGHDVEVFAARPAREETVVEAGVRVHWLRETDREKFGERIGPIFAARHAEAPFDVLEGPDYSADARGAVALVPGVPLVVKMHTPMLMVFRLNRERDWRAVGRGVLGQMKRNFSLLLRSRQPGPVVLGGADLQWAAGWNEIEKAHARRAVLVATPSSDLGRFAVEEWSVARERVRLAPYPYTPTEDFLRIPEGGNGCTVGFVGRLERRKGIEDLAAALPRVLAEVPEARFRFVGAIGRHRESGLSYDNWIKERVGERGARCLEFTGKIEAARIAGELAGIDVAVFPSLWENFPNVCLEAMAAGRAIVASQAGGMREMLDEGRCGVLVGPQNPTDLAQAVIKLLQDPEERKRFGALARERVLSAYNEDVIGRLYEEIYAEAARRSRGGKAEMLTTGAEGRAGEPAEGSPKGDTSGAREATTS